MQYAYITEFCQFDLNEHIVRCRFTEMGVTESYCNSVESSSLEYNASKVMNLKFYLIRSITKMSYLCFLNCGQSALNRIYKGIGTKKSRYFTTPWPLPKRTYRK